MSESTDEKGGTYFQIPGFAGKYYPPKGKPTPAKPSMEKIRADEAKKALQLKIEQANNTVRHNINAEKQKATADRMAREAAQLAKVKEAASRRLPDGTMLPPGVGTSTDYLKRQEAIKNYKKPSKIAALKARLKGGSVPAAGSWLQWSGAKKGNN
jgi:hypothetical protein